MVEVSSALALWISLSAVIAVWSDYAFGQCDPLPVVVGAGILALMLDRKDRSQERQLDLVIAALLITGYVWLSSPAPYFLPLSREWDGANHLALSNALVHSASHRALVDAKFQLPWGGTLYSYPWGFHAFLAGTSMLFGVQSLEFVHALIAVVTGALFSGLFAELRRLSVNNFFSACALLWVLLLKPGLPYMIGGNFWTMLIGVLIGFHAVQHTSLGESGFRRELQLLVLWSGLLLVYPLLFPPFAIALVLRKIAARRFIPWGYVWTLSGALIISGPYFLMSFSDNVQRLGRDGLRISYWFDDFLSEAVGWALIVAGTCIALGRLRRLDLLSSCLLGAVVSLLCIIAAGLPGYWQDKLFSVSTLFAVPCLCLGLAEAERVNAAQVRGVFAMILRVAMRLVVAALLVLSPRTYLMAINPAFSASMYDTLLWLDAHHAGRPVAVVSDLYTAMWFQASRPEIRFLPPRIDAAVKYRIAEATVLLPYYAELLKGGGLLVIDSATLKNVAVSALPRCTRAIFRRGHVAVFECT